MSEFSENDRAVLNCIFNPNLPLDDIIHEENSGQLLKDEEELTTETKTSKKIEVDGITAAEKSDYEEAIDLFTRAIETVPTASAFNNRAQVYRLKGDDTKAFDDLEQSLALSGGIGRSGCQAFCQRGLLYRKYLQEEKAREDFRAAAYLGSQFAKLQLTEMNPYAAMCNQMLNQIMKKMTCPSS